MSVHRPQNVEHHLPILLALLQRKQSQHNVHDIAYIAVCRPAQRVECSSLNLLVVIVERACEVELDQEYYDWVQLWLLKQRIVLELRQELERKAGETYALTFVLL